MNRHIGASLVTRIHDLLPPKKLRTAYRELQDRHQLVEERLRQTVEQLEELQHQHEAQAQYMEKRIAACTAQWRAANEELKTTNARLETCSYVVAHDLRASLRILEGLLVVFNEDHAAGIPAAAQEDLLRIKGAARNMSGMLAQLLRLSQPNRPELHRQPVDITAMSHELLQELRIVDGDRHVEVKIEPQLRAFAEPLLLREALQNLLGNAWKFTSMRPQARIEIGVRHAAASAPGDVPQAVFHVRDNGVGFDMQQQDELFKPFSRLESGREFEGTGIGLVATKRIVEWHDGRIWAEAQPGQGASFYFTLG